MSEEAWNWTTEQVLPSELGAGDSFMQQLLDELARQKWSERDVFAIRLAMEEALVNAVRHGNSLARDKQVRVACKISSAAFWARVCDDGNGFKPEALPDPTTPENLDRASGRGVLLMRKFMSRVEYNDSGNCVVMEKQRTQPTLAESV